MNHTPAHSQDDEVTSAENRHDQLTTAPDATEADAAPRIEVSEHDGNTRIDIAPEAAVRPGPGPGMPEADPEDADSED
ncbi:multidrug transporter [Microbacterium sp. NPDC028030]|uniref:multidrug transporter n=1 Tax=Microbacterium sp. NPDC028030 TaxID=3155124 RepID=UPI0033CDADD7